MILQDWLSNGWLVKHRTSRQEISDLLSVAERDIHESQVQGLSSDWRLNIAYNAALQAATAALAACGYRASRDAHHYRVIQSLVYTIGASPALVAQFDQFRKKRNIGSYDRIGSVSNKEAAEMTLLAQKLCKDIREWLRAYHLHLIE